MAPALQGWSDQEGTMNRTVPLAVVLAVVSTAVPVELVTAGDVNVGISIGAPAPIVAPVPVVVAPPVIAAPPAILAAPPVAIVPGTRVYHVPSVSYNLFAFGGRYYSFHNNAWFIAVSPGAPWTMVTAEAVPVAVRGVPVEYYRIPPGHGHRMEAGEEHHRGGKGCPPGLAKQGRC
jgi:hypothetical protein